MKKNFFSKKLAACLVLSVGFISTWAEDKQAATIMNNVDQIINQAREINKHEIIRDIGTRNNWGHILQVAPFPDGNSFALTDTKVVAESNTQSITDEMVYIGKSTLRNMTDMEQSLSSDSFQTTVTDTVTTTTTQSIGNSISASSKFQVPYIGETGISITSNYNFTNSTANTATNAVTYIVPSQKIVVPAHSDVEVTAYLKKAKITGNVKLQGKLIGEEWGQAQVNRYNNYFGWMFGQYTDYRFSLQDYAKRYGGDKGDMNYGTYFFGIVPNEDGSINVQGSGKYEASIGAELIVVVKDLQTQKSSSITLDGTPVTDRSNSDNPSTTVHYNSKQVNVQEDVNTDKVTLYKDADYQGASISFGVGTYNFWDFGDVGNDELSSIKVPSGYTVTIYEDSFLNGASQILTSDSNWLGTFNDKVSSIVIEKN